MIAYPHRVTYDHMQRTRRQDPYPSTWEIPALVALTVTVVLAYGLHAGRGAATLLVGAGWTWPSSQGELWRSLPALLGGDASAGLKPGLEAGASPSALLLALSITVVETSLVLLMAAGSLWWTRRYGPGRLRGSATRAEAQRVLGRARLRAVAAVVRPDLYRRTGLRLRRRAGAALAGRHSEAPVRRALPAEEK